MSFKLVFILLSKMNFKLTVCVFFLIISSTKDVSGQSFYDLIIEPSIFANVYGQIDFNEECNTKCIDQDSLIIKEIKTNHHGGGSFSMHFKSSIWSYKKHLILDSLDRIKVYKYQDDINSYDEYKYNYINDNIVEIEYTSTIFDKKSFTTLKYNEQNVLELFSQSIYYENDSISHVVYDVELIANKIFIKGEKTNEMYMVNEQGQYISIFTNGYLSLKLSYSEFGAVEKCISYFINTDYMIHRISTYFYNNRNKLVKEVYSIYYRGQLEKDIYCFYCY
jgi:hypothetical protein